MYVTIDNSEKLKNLLKDIFTDSFMKKYTKFENFEYFKYSSAVILNWDADRMIYDEKLLDMFVKESTSFRNFDEMVRTASDIRFSESNR